MKTKRQIRELLNALQRDMEGFSLKDDGSIRTVPTEEVRTMSWECAEHKGEKKS